MGRFQNLMNYGLPLALGAGQWWQQRQARGRAEDIYEETKHVAGRRYQAGVIDYRAGMEGILGEAAGRTAGALGEFGTREQQIMGGYGEMRGALSGAYGEQASYFGEQFDQRTRDITAKLEGLGTQARKDIERRYGDVSTQRQQALSARGFGGSTVGAAVEMGVQREKGGELGRLEEGLRRENIGLTSQLTGQALGAQMGLSQQALGARERLWGGELGAQQGMMTNRLNLMTGLTGDQLMAHQSLFGGQMGMFTGLSGDYLNTVGNVNIGYPTPNAMNIAGNIGAGSYPVPDYGSSGLAAIGIGAGAAGAGIGLGMLAAAPFTGGASLAGAPAFLACDRRLKEDITSVDLNEILEKVEQLEISRWKYMGRDRYHTGPMAQDFKALGLGEDDHSIHTVDAFGVCLAAIKALASRVRELEGAT